MIKILPEIIRKADSAYRDTDSRESYWRELNVSACSRLLIADKKALKEKDEIKQGISSLQTEIEINSGQKFAFSQYLTASENSEG